MTDTDDLECSDCGRLWFSIKAALQCPCAYWDSHGNPTGARGTDWLP